MSESKPVFERGMAIRMARRIAQKRAAKLAAKKAKKAAKKAKDKKKRRCNGKKIKDEIQRTYAFLKRLGNEKGIKAAMQGANKCGGAAIVRAKLQKEGKI
jgi:hypothetical protein